MTSPFNKNKGNDLVPILEWLCVYVCVTVQHHFGPDLKLSGNLIPASLQLQQQMNLCQAATPPCILFTRQEAEIQEF